MQALPERLDAAVVWVLPNGVISHVSDTFVRLALPVDAHNAATMKAVACCLSQGPTTPALPAGGLVWLPALRGGWLRPAQAGH